MKGKFCYKILFSFCFMLIGIHSSFAVPINVDQVIWQPDSGFLGTDLSASIEFNYINSTKQFEIILENTSGDLNADEFSSVLLTGLGFNLPDNYSIIGGNIYGVSSDGADLTTTWGYDNDPLNSGPFLDVTTLSVNAVVSTMESSNEPGSALLFYPDPNVNYQFKGPNYGIMDPNQTGIGGLPYILGPATFTIELNADIGGAAEWASFFQEVNNNDVVVSFGSPTAPVPEPTTMLLLGSGLIGLAGLRRKFKKK